MKQNQLSFSSLSYQNKKKRLRREVFLNEMNQAIPWKELLRALRKHYKENRDNGRPSYAAELMLRIYFMQQWYQLSDEGMEEALYDTHSLRNFAGLELGSDNIPDQNTILNFRHLLEEHKLTERFFEIVNKHLEQHGLLMKKGTIVDATIINAPSSTKNSEKQRDPEMKQTKKGNQWYFGMKAHVGSDSKTGIVHTLTTTPANNHDSTEFENLLHGEEEVVYGDKAYANKEQEAEFRSRGVSWRIARKAQKGKVLSETDRAWNRKQSSVRALGEHAFRVVKSLWRYTKVRYRGIAKNTVQIFSLFSLANLFMVRKKLQRAMV